MKWTDVQDIALDLAEAQKGGKAPREALNYSHRSP
jgi:Fe-S-cluster formation regulator IscX/YfhJ